ncbi:MAG TPA: nucleoside-diphosphate sugar epimerase/dehydratase [Acetobacteraceae bacterium]|nr:nucleoside-diphosphate sugar epimerase/dehydratase [Acetobacteraceae bacterium]
MQRSQFRIGVNILLDGLLAALGVVAACWLADPAHPAPQPAALPAAGTAAIWLIGVPFGMSRQHWRFTSLGDIAAIGSIAVLAALLISLLLVGVGAALPSTSFPVILAITLGLGLIAPRLLYRLARMPGAEAPPADAENALVLGEGEAAELFLNALARDPLRRYRLLGLLANSARETGRRIHNQPILGSVDQLGPILSRFDTAEERPSLLIVASAEIRGEALHGILAEAEARGLRVARAPSPTALAPTSAQGAADLALRPIAIEDLLNRPQVSLDREGMARLIQGRRVLVTGAGGSIGSELARQVAGFGPERLILLDSSEYALWSIDLELAESAAEVPRLAVIADVRDAGRMVAVCAAQRPHLVFHAAALKHVPMVEANPLEGLATNAVGTKHVADAARAAGASLMVLISTDKAVNPSSVMGASKRLAEMYAQGLDVAARHAGPQGLDVAARQAQGGMRLVTVRFGNVLGSTGSVVPLFRRQLARGGPLTVTHPDMRRYFMTVREAVSLVLQASVVGAGNAALPVAEGGIFVLDMGEPVKIVDLARQMIRLAGLRPDQDIPIRFTGLRPGEKLFEELFHGKERPIPTAYPGLLMAAPRVADAAFIGRALEEIQDFCTQGDEAAALALLSRLVPEFRPSVPAEEPLALARPAG